MKNFTLILALLLLPVAALAAGMGESAGHDLDALWQKAQADYDLEVEDAVILLDSRQIHLGKDNTVSTRVHRVVWIGTAVGIRGYADLRIPWNTATCDFQVEKLRTWREGQWWPDAEKLSDTAIVHTLPYAVDRADDYTVMRETMLLHDGVELGCIMETAYTITEKGVPGRGGLHVFPQNDPVIHAELRIMADSGARLQHVELNGVAAPTSLNPKQGTGLVWTMNSVPALGLPHTGEPAVYEPTVVWTGWRHWKELAQIWVDAFMGDANLDADQIAAFQGELNPTLSPRQKVDAVGEYLNRMTRRVRYDTGHWDFAPRPASRTLATAYGHDLDRAVLAAALIKAAGLTAEPVFVGNGTTLVAETYARLEDMGQVLIRVPEINDTLLDPTTGHRVAYDQFFGHHFWYVAAPSGTLPHNGDLGHKNKSLTVAIDLVRGDEGKWEGSGHFRGTSLFSGYSDLVAASDVTSGPVKTLVGSVVPGAVPSNSALTILLQEEVAGHFDLTGFDPATDGLDRKTLQIGQPAGGLMSRLPGDVHLYETTRQTPVLGVGGWQQEVILRVEATGDQILHLPEAAVLENQAGTFRLDVQQDQEYLTLTRTLNLAPGNVSPAGWPELRALLLAESDPAHGLVIFK